MEHVDNNMDDLFRKAGELYPLKTTESDWDGVLGKLKEEIPGERTPATSGDRNRRWALLLLLIPAALGSAIYFSHSSKNSSSTVINTTNAADDKADDKNANAKPIIQSDKITSSSDAVNNNSTYHSNEKYNPGIENASAAATRFREALAKPLSLSVAGSAEIISVNGKPLPSSAAALNTTVTAKEKKNKTNTQKGFYVTVLGGPNASTVKQQSVSQTGYSIGALIGYRFNQHFSLESGLMWDKMFYYSSGEYFNQSKLIIPSNEHIVNVNGNCNMFEIPLNIRYDFASRSAHSNFYVKGGLSSYLMKKEYYSYNAEGPSYVPWAGDSTYYNATKNILSILQISAGYEYAIGKNTKIQIEPYLKLPLQGIGVGSMPISTFGLNIGISYSFH